MRDPVLVVILVLAAGLRLYGLDHGLPFVYNPDEANIMARALSVARGLDPGYYLYPSFFFYFLFGVMGSLYVAGRTFGRYESLRAFEARFFENPTDFYLAGRLVGVLAALATVVLTYRLAAKHFGRTAGRAAALFVAVAYFNVRDAHYLKHDVPCGLLLIASIWAIDRALERQTLRAYVLAGLFLGVSFATHYYMIFLAPTFVVCHWVHRRLRRFEWVLAAGAVSAVTFFLLSPFVVLNFSTALEHMRANRQVVVDRGLDPGLSIFPSLDSYVRFLLEQGLGYVLCGLVLAGLVLLARRGMKPLALWASFPVFFLAFVSYTWFAGRYLNPVLPPLAVTAGLAVSAVAGRFGRAAALAIAVLASLQPLYRAVQVDALFNNEDTRTIARRWILENLDPNQTIALQSYSVPLPQSGESFRAALEANGALSEIDRRGKYKNLLEVAEKDPRGFTLYFFGKGDELDRIYIGYDDLLEGLDPLRELGVDVVVLRHPPVSPPPAVRALFLRVAEKGELMKSVSPFAEGASGIPYMDNEDWPPSRTLSFKGPLVEIWSLGSEP